MRSRSTEIDYVLVSFGLSLFANGVFPGVSSHFLVLCIFDGLGG